MTVQDCPTTRSICLIWQDVKAMVEDILSNPIFTNYMTFNPHTITRESGREYSEFFTVDRAHQIQVCIAYIISESTGLTPLSPL